MAPTKPNPSTGPRAKIERAGKHLADLIDSIQAFHDSDPYTIIREPDPEGGWRARLDPWPEIPVEIALIFGDLVHNLRASLDILVCDLVRHHRPQDLHDRSGFPFATDAKRLVREVVPHKVKGVRNDAQKAIIRLKPYEGGNEALWQLHRLDILDKHRLILPTVLANEALNVGKMMSKGLSDLLGEEAPDFDFWVRSASPCDEEGGVIFRDKTRPEPDYELELRFNIALHEPGLVECEPIIPFGTQMIDVIESTVTEFDRFF